MRKLKSINVKKRIIALMLLCVYAFSILPAAFFHNHHQHNIIATSNESHCDIATQYGTKSNHCGHQAHISKVIEKCALCNHDSMALYTFDFVAFSFYAKRFVKQFAVSFQSYELTYALLISNKGPPSV